MGKIAGNQDAFGQMMIDYLDGRPLDLIVERDDGFVVSGGFLDIYFAKFKKWPPHQQKAIQFARGKILDVGCGAGRCLIYLQDKGFDAVGIDNSPLAVKACKRQGIRKVFVKSFTEIDRSFGTFDTIILYGNNFALFGTPKRTSWMLRKFHRFTSPDGRIIAEACDPYQTDISEHLEYHKHNRMKGQPSGQVRIRVRYKKLTSPWFDLLLLSEKELREIIRGTGWKVSRAFSSKNQPFYTVILEKE